MMILSLAVNVVVLVPVIGLLLLDSPGMNAAFGPDLPARRILICLYLAILLASAALLAALALGWPPARGHAHTLLALQVLYKLATVPALGLGHPVALANLGIALLHGTTLTLALRAS